MKKLIAVLMMVCLVCLCLSGCGFKKSDDGKIKIVCTTFAAYDWVRNVVGENNNKAELYLVGDKGMDLHSYQPSALDIATIAECDMLVYVGSEADIWTEKTLENSGRKDVCIIRLFDLLSEEEVTLGHHDEHGHESSPDEHVWLSLNVAKRAVMDITDVLSTGLDPDGAVEYRKNCDEYTVGLNELDSKYKEAVSGSDDKTVIVADRFPFLYLFGDYGINYHAAFPGCSADTDVSFENVIHLAGEADNLEKKALIVTESSDSSIVSAVIEAMKTENVTTVTLDSCQTVTDIDKSEYLTIMEKNLVALKKALE